MKSNAMIFIATSLFITLSLSKNSIKMDRVRQTSNEELRIEIDELKRKLESHSGALKSSAARNSYKRKNQEKLRDEIQRLKKKLRNKDEMMDKEMYRFKQENAQQLKKKRKRFKNYRKRWKTKNCRMRKRLRRLRKWKWIRILRKISR